MDIFVAFHEELMFLTSLRRPQVNFVPDFSHVSVEKRRRAVCLGYSWVRITQSYCWCKSRHYWKVNFTNMKRSKIIQIWFFHIHHPQPHCPSFVSPWRTGYQEKPHTDRKELSSLRELYWWTVRAHQWVGRGVRFSRQALAAEEVSRLRQQDNIFCLSDFCPARSLAISRGTLCCIKEWITQKKEASPSWWVGEDKQLFGCWVASRLGYGSQQRQAGCRGAPGNRSFWHMHWRVENFQWMEEPCLFRRSKGRLILRKQLVRVLGHVCAGFVL